MSSDGFSRFETHRSSVALLVLLCLAMFLPGFSRLPPMDRDEPRFAQASKQMLESGDFVAIRYQSEARNKKPVGIYWLQATAVELGTRLGVDHARTQIWLYRIPSLLGAIGAVLATYWAALALTSRRAALVAAALLASTVLLNVEARLAKTDAVLLLTVVVAMGALARLYPKLRGGDKPEPTFGTAAIFWTAVAAGLLIKGPITPMFPAFAVLVLWAKDRSARWLTNLRPGLGLLWTVLLVLPWFVLILLRTRGAFLADSVGHDMLGKVAGAQESHGAPPGTYLLAFWATAWPLAPFVAFAAASAWRRRADPAVAFLLAWVVPAWLLFEAFPTKLPHYVLPTYPALAILAAGLLSDGEVKSWRSTMARWIACLLIALLPLALLVVLARGQGFLWDQLSFGSLAGGLAVSLVLLVTAWRASGRLAGRAVGPAAAACAGAALLGYGFIFGHLLTPAVADRLALSPHLAVAGAQALDSGCPGQYAAAGTHEPSLVFLTGTNLLLTDGIGAAAFLKSGDCRVAFVDRREEPNFKTSLGDMPEVKLARRVEGTAINGAKPLDIGVYVRQRQAP